MVCNHVAIANALGGTSQRIAGGSPQIDKVEILASTALTAECGVPSHEPKKNHMSQTVISIKQKKYDAGAARVDMKLEAPLIPVSDFKNLAGLRRSPDRDHKKL
jgi:hypothetical protein